MLSVFITPWMKPTFIHCAIRAAWRSATFRSSARKRCGELASAGSCRAIVYSASLAHAFHVAARGIKLKGPDADVARRHAGQHGAGKHVLAVDLLACRRDGEGARRGDAQRVHGLADQHLAKHRSDGGLAVAAAGERRAARALEGDVATASLPVDHLAEKQRAAVAELR